ncbi:MAG: penicillin-insensitive murein endopeptidase, partial [Hyphomicrobium sp.]
LCEAAGPDRGWLGKVRPIQGHYYHFHIRIGCPAGSAQSCAPQKPVTGEDGCGKEVQEWLARLAPPKMPPPPKPPGWKPAPPAPPVTLAQLPQECTAVLESGPDGVDVPEQAKVDLKAIANAPAALKPHLRKLHTAKK